MKKIIVSLAMALTVPAAALANAPTPAATAPAAAATAPAPAGTIFGPAFHVADLARAQRFYVDGGFVQVADNLVSVLTNRAIPAKAVDVAGAEESLRAALTTDAAGIEEMAIRERRVLQARGQLRVASRAR